MKYTRSLAALLVASLMLSLAACGGTPAATGTTPPAATSEPAQTSAEEVSVRDAAYYDLESGVVIRQWPQAFQPYADDAYFNCFTMDKDLEYAGAVLSWVMRNPEGPYGYNMAYYAVVIGSSNPSVTTESMEKMAKEAGIFAEGYEPEFKEFTTKSGQKMMVCYITNDDGGVDLNGMATPEQQAAYEAMFENLDELLLQMEFVKPIPKAAAGKVVFTTVDLDGNPVDSSVFANAEYTMINIWGSFCAPCIGEMGDLMKMDAEMDNVQIITILGDATSPDDDTAEDAREIVETLNLTLPVYLVNEEIMALLPFDAFPTSFLVDREGNPLGAACVGAVGTESYRAWIQNCIGG